jgi:hypothetical protein
MWPIINIRVPHKLFSIPFEIVKTVAKYFITGIEFGFADFYGIDPTG